MSKKVKTPADSAIEMREMVMPHHANPRGTIFGGQIMAWIDIAASMAASKHANKSVVTAHVDHISFLAPIQVGDQVHIKACCNYVGKTSMEIGVKVCSENPLREEYNQATVAYLTFVALDGNGKPTEVPRLDPVTDEDKRRFDNAKIRWENRMQIRKTLKKG